MGGGGLGGVCTRLIGVVSSTRTVLSRFQNMSVVLVPLRGRDDNQSRAGTLEVGGGPEALAKVRGMKPAGSN